MFSYSPARKAETTLPCRNCKAPLTAQRTCHEAYLACSKCGKVFQIQEYRLEMDKALEEFLEAINCDRI